MKRLLFLFLLVLLLGSCKTRNTNSDTKAHNQVGGKPVSSMTDASEDSCLFGNSISWVDWGGREADPVRCATFSPDGKNAILGTDHRMFLWNVETRRPMKLLGMYKNATMAACYLPGDSTFASATGNTVFLWSAKSLSWYDTLTESNEVLDLGYSNDGALLFTLCKGPGIGRTVRVWDFAKKKVIKDFSLMFHNVFAASFSPRKHLIALSVDIELKGPDKESHSTLVWDVDADSILQRHQVDEQKATVVRFSADGRFLASGFEYVESRFGVANDTTLRVWDALSGDLLWGYADFGSSVTVVAFSPKSDCIASAANDKFISVRKIAGGAQLRFSNDQAPTSEPLAFSDDGQLLLSGAPDGKAILWNAQDGSLMGFLDPKNKHGHRKASVWAVAYSPDGRYVVSRSNSRKILVCRASDGEVQWDLDPEIGPEMELSISPNSKYLAAGYQTIVKVWDVENHKLVSVLKGHRPVPGIEQDIGGTSFSSDSRLLVSGSVAGDVRVWDFHSGKCISVLFDSTAPRSNLANAVSRVAFGVNDSCVIAAYPREIRIWDIYQRKILRVLRDKDASSGGVFMESIFRLYAGKDGRSLISCSSDIFNRENAFFCRVWDIASGSVITRTRVENAATALSPNERYVASGWRAGLKIWELASGKLVAHFPDAPTDIIYDVAWSPDGTRILSGSYDGTTLTWNVPPLLVSSLRK